MSLREKEELSAWYYSKRGMVFEKKKAETEEEREENSMFFRDFFKSVCLGFCASGQKILTSISFWHQLPGIHNPTHWQRVWQYLGFSINPRLIPGEVSVCTVGDVEVMIMETDKALSEGRVCLAVSEEEWEKVRLPGMGARVLLFPTSRPMLFYLDLEQVLRVEI